MNFNLVVSLCFSYLAFLIAFHPIKAEAITHLWIAVPKSEFGEQLWDKNSLQTNPDGSIRVFSKFIPKSNFEITNDILYTMDINCSQNTFRDVAVGTKHFNAFQNKDSKWKHPNEDKLILGVINQVCTFGKNQDAT